MGYPSSARLVMMEAGGVDSASHSRPEGLGALIPRYGMEMRIDRSQRRGYLGVVVRGVDLKRHQVEMGNPVRSSA